MKTLFLECSMGAAGDMLNAALLELLPDHSLYLEKMNALGLEGVVVAAETITKQGICGTQMRILIDGAEETVQDVHSHGHHEHHEHHEQHEHDHRVHEHDGHDGHHGHHHVHHHASMHEVTEQINSLNVSDWVKQHAIAVYQEIAAAEAHAHGRPVTEIHFHEVGTKDAIADIVGFCLLIEMLHPDRIIASPVHVGSGHVHCAHGILPVPAPATAYLLRDIPIYGGHIEGELCTPTGAALLRHFAADFSAIPIMRVEKIGYGIGKKDFSQMNCLRAFLGETESPAEQILELCCNLDDITGEAMSFAQEELLAAGALDVFTIPVTMKKSRPGYLLTCLCKPEQREQMLKLLFRHTTTLGIRERICQRYVMQRNIETKQTEFGMVHIKRAAGFGAEHSKPEYDDLAQIARKHDLPLDSVRKSIIQEEN